MRLEESLCIQRYIGYLADNSIPKYCINIGAGNLKEQELKKPWIYTNVFSPLNAMDCKIIHTDFILYDGVEIMMDLSNPGCLEFAQHLEGPKIILCSNVFEHLQSDVRKTAITSIQGALKLGDYLIISVPHKYPFHPDPIDTLFRPSSDELSNLFDLEWLSIECISCGSFATDLKGMSISKQLRKILKPLWPFQKPSKYLSNLHRLTFATRPYRVSLVFGRKVA